MYEVIIVSSIFQGKTTLARHRLVNEQLKDEIAQIHAFTQVNLQNFVDSCLMPEIVYRRAMVKTARRGSRFIRLSLSDVIYYMHAYAATLRRRPYKRYAVISS